jgi:hypothetical protein
VPLSRERRSPSFSNFYLAPAPLVGCSGSLDGILPLVVRHELTRDVSFSALEAVWPRIIQAYEHDLVLAIISNVASREDCRRRLP